MVDRMKVALRVFQSIQNHAHPSSVDIELLKDWVHPSERNVDTDVLACIIINQEMRRRKQNRIMQDQDNGASA